MLIAHIDGNPREAQPGLAATCPQCDGACIAKCGPLVSWHWAHVATDNCDPWSEPDSVWHRDWQRQFPLESREIVITGKNGDKHRADIKLPANGHVIEFQHTSISIDDIRDRELFYGPNMRWVFDAVDPYESGRIELTSRRGLPSADFEWRQARRCLDFCLRPVYLDFGGGRMLALRDSTHRTYRNGDHWTKPICGRLMSADVFIAECFAVTPCGRCGHWMHAPESVERGHCGRCEQGISVAP